MRFKFIRWRSFCMEFVITFSVNSTFFTFLHRILSLLSFYATLSLILPRIYVKSNTFANRSPFAMAFKYPLIVYVFQHNAIFHDSGFCYPHHTSRDVVMGRLASFPLLRCSNTRWRILCRTLRMQFFLLLAEKREAILFQIRWLSSTWPIEPEQVWRMVRGWEW